MNRLNDQQIGKILIDKSYLEAESVKKYTDLALEKNIPLINVLVNEGLLTKDLIGQAIAEHYKVPYADLNSIVPNKDQILKIPELLAKEYNLVLFSFKKGVVNFASDDPTNPKLIASLEAFAESSELFEDIEKIEISYSLTEDIEAVYANYEVPLNDKLQELITKNEVSVSELLNAILSSAYDSMVTDIHFEPTDVKVIVRFRVDGVLQKVAEVNSDLYEKLINRVKVLSRLRIDEHFTIQDGSFSHQYENKKFDLRVSFVPTLYGEKLAVRVLAQYVGGLGLDQVGFSEEEQRKLEESTSKPFGMIIVSGPTGSGKTTTLYAALNRVISSAVNVMTIEDPVEYRIKGATQVQVNKETGITFASGLRSLVRQDPDIILVGEIRDKESAEIAVNAALTGHLLLSTFHANDASTVIPRLIDMGIEPFLLSSTLELVIAQRLVRKLCDTCKMSVNLAPLAIEKKYGKEVAQQFGKSKVTVYEAKGCESCNFKGYKGRTAIFEIIQNSEEMRNLMLRKPSAGEIRSLARKNGVKSLFQDGIEKVKLGITTIAEILRVAQIND